MQAFRVFIIHPCRLEEMMHLMHVSRCAWRPETEADIGLLGEAICGDMS